MARLLFERGRDGLRPLDHVLASRPPFHTEKASETA